MEYRQSGADEEAISQYEHLFRACFPGTTHLRAPYLRWLYQANPAGRVRGFDAFEGDELAGHYACIPTSISVAGREAPALLSLNTATHPRFQGKGLFTRLAAMTYEAGAKEGFKAVFGVANANSTPGFTRKLGFQLVAPLEARVGLGSLGVRWDVCEASVGFRRVWNGPSIRWRMANPVNPVRMERRGDGSLALRARTQYPMLDAYSEVMADVGSPLDATASFPGLRVFLGAFPRGACSYGSYLPIPMRLRPSPLNLIWLDLTGQSGKLDAQSVQFSFIDFDPY